MADSEEILVPRPWVQVAAFCQTAIAEAGTGNLSIIKLVDGVSLPGSTREMLPTPLQLTLVLILKSGEMQGQYALKMRCNTPSRKQITGPDIPVYFEGNDRGIQAVVPMGMFAEEQGIYWFDVLLDPDIVLTRIPLRVIYQYTPPSMSPQGFPGNPAPPMG